MRLSMFVDGMLHNSRAVHVLGHGGGYILTKLPMLVDVVNACICTSRVAHPLGNGECEYTYEVAHILGYSESIILMKLPMHLSIVHVNVYILTEFPW